MSGHNKWSKIKRKKESTDGQKSKIFSKFSRLISLESKKTSGNINSPSLKAVIEQARSYNMPSDNIERAVKKGSGGGSEALERVTYEAYGPEGVALIIEGLTENRNKASGEIKHLLSKHGANLGATGSVLWAFTKKENDWMPNNEVIISEESGEILASLIEDLEENDEVQEVFTNAKFPTNLE